MTKESQVYNSCVESTPRVCLKLLTFLSEAKEAEISRYQSGFVVAFLLRGKVLVKFFLQLKQ